jgi:hypothetical protein
MSSWRISVCCFSEADLQFTHHRPVGVPEVMPSKVGDADLLASRD